MGVLLGKPYLLSPGEFSLWLCFSCAKSNSSTTIPCHSLLWRNVIEQNPSASMGERFGHRAQLIQEIEEGSASILSSSPVPHTYGNISSMSSQRSYLEIKVTTSNWQFLIGGMFCMGLFSPWKRKKWDVDEGRGGMSSTSEDRRAQLSSRFHSNRALIMHAFHWQFLWKLVKTESTAHSRW